MKCFKPLFCAMLFLGGLLAANDAEAQYYGGYGSWPPPVVRTMPHRPPVYYPRPPQYPPVYYPPTYPGGGGRGRGVGRPDGGFGRNRPLPPTYGCRGARRADGACMETPRSRPTGRW